MRVRSLTVSLVLTTSAFAQAGCPRERAEHVPLQVTMQAAVECESGVNMDVGGLQLRSGTKSCPLVVVITPAHDRPEPAAQETRTEQYGSVHEFACFFDCKPHHFLFFVTSYSCEMSDRMELGVRPLLRTVPCLQTAN